MKKTEAWKTDDDKIWKTEAEAVIHEMRGKALEELRGVYYHRMFECAEDVVDFFIRHSDLCRRLLEIVEPAK